MRSGFHLSKTKTFEPLEKDQRSVVVAQWWVITMVLACELYFYAWVALSTATQQHKSL